MKCKVMHCIENEFKDGYCKGHYEYIVNIRKNNIDGEENNGNKGN